MNKTGIILWDSLLVHTGRTTVRSDWKKRLLEESVPLSSNVVLPKQAGIIVFLNRKNDGIEGIKTSLANVRKVLNRFRDKMKKDRNAHAASLSFSVIPLPQQKFHREKILSTFNRLYQEDLFAVGLRVYEELTEKRKVPLSWSYLADMLTNVSFRPLASLVDGKIELARIPIPYNGSGIYFVKEYLVGDPLGQTVYSGKSVYNIVDTVKKHFRQWHGKDHPSHTDSRGESRGKWIEKVLAGTHTYSIGVLLIPHPANTSSKKFKRDILKIEEHFIKLLNPRDNEAKKDPEPEEQLAIFDKGGNIAEEIEEDDLIPF